jgi:REP element-mobilizing transposase RayT
MSEDKKVVGASSSMQQHSSHARGQDAPTTSKKVVGASSSMQQHSSDAREQDAPTTSLTAPNPVWQYFNPRREFNIRTGGNLPHWEQGSVWYFVTFRLADALPASVVEELQQQRTQWRQAHDLDNLTREELDEYHRLFSERYENLLHAGSGSCILREPLNAEIVGSALRFFEGKRYDLDEFVIMPNHVHALVRPAKDNRLVDILHSWKSFTANQINHRLQESGQLWQHESYDHIVRNENAMQAIRHYIRNNPKVARASSSLFSK